jgi:hypothetical protein
MKTKRNPKQHKEGIIQMKTEINEIRNRKTIDKIDETKFWFFEKNIDKLSATQTKKRKTFPVTKVTKGNMTTDAADIKRIQAWYEQLIANKFEHLIDMSQFFI